MAGQLLTVKNPDGSYSAYAPGYNPTNTPAAASGNVVAGTPVIDRTNTGGSAINPTAVNPNAGLFAPAPSYTPPAGTQILDPNTLKPVTPTTPTANTSGVTTGNTTPQSAADTLETASTSGAPANPGIISGLQTVANTNPLTSGVLSTNYNNAVQALLNYKNNLATQFSKMETSDQALPVVLGQEGAIQKQQAAELDNLQQAVNSAQTAMEQGVQEQGAETTALSAAGNVANTAQANVQSGINNAGLLAAPGTQYTQVPYNNQIIGANGQPVSGGVAGSLQGAVANAVQLIKNGSGYANALGTLSAYGQAGQNALVSALGPNFNINASNADAAAAAANINTENTTVTNTASTGYDQATKDYQDLNQSYTGAQNLGSLLASTMEKGGINSAGSIDLNQAANTLAAHLSSSDYAQFISTLTNTANAYQAILTQNGATTPTSADSALLKILNPNSSMTAIISSLNQLNNEVYTGKVLPAAAKANGYLKQLNG